MFVTATVVITAAGLVIASNGSYSRLKADGDSYPYSITFNKGDIISTSSSGYVDKITINKQTKSGKDFGTVISVDPGYNGTSYTGSYIAEVRNNDGDASVSMTFHFQGVLSADSVTLIGEFNDGFNTSYTVTQSILVQLL